MAGGRRTVLSHLRQTAGIRRDHAGDRLRVGEVLEDLVRLQDAARVRVKAAAALGCQKRF